MDVRVTESRRELNETAFDRFVSSDGERLRRALVARFGVDVGNDVCADAVSVCVDPSLPDVTFPD